MKKSKKNSEEKTPRTYFRSSGVAPKKSMCIYEGHQDVECPMDYKCANCMRSEMSREQYDEFIANLNIPKGV